jgi:hypothetical protein
MAPYPSHLRFKCGTGHLGVECSDRELTTTVAFVSVCVRACGCAAPVAMRSPIPAPNFLTLHPPARQALVNVVSNMCMLPAIYVAMLQGLRFEAGVHRHPLARRTRGTCSTCSQMTVAHI